ncbi:hypothetical protein D3OALGA1CA_3922 [Olavius algarvensis associated proteobacterium Delta 3]|nr:hypothetical protein D3OALGA1CA_3922 [Olavius algarvensis associated proteobacterium Delta 3]
MITKNLDYVYWSLSVQIASDDFPHLFFQVVSIFPNRCGRFSEKFQRGCPWPLQKTTCKNRTNLNISITDCFLEHF